MAIAKRHALRYRVVTDPDGTRRLICAARRCGEGVVGAWHGLTGWRDGVHQSDYEAGRFTVTPPHDRLGLAGNIGEAVR